MIQYAQLENCFDAARMQAELQLLQSSCWKPHYNTLQYQGGWTTLSLRSINGDLNSGIAIQSTSLQKDIVYRDTALLAHCAYINTVLNFFECEKLSVRLMNLQPGAIIKTHTDYDMRFEEGEARFHIPIQTNPGVSFFLDEERIPMQEGECWYLNLSLPHRVENRGEQDRVHLVIDCLVNDWVKELLANRANVIMRTPAQSSQQNYRDADKTKIVEQLRLMGTRVSNELADKMEKGES